MTDQTITIHMDATMLVSRCIACGVTYGVTTDFDADRRKDKQSFFCPNGHPMSYEESEADRLRRERDNLRQQMARVEYERNAEGAARLKAEKELARVNRRINSGVCPCCHRTFVNVQRHMKTKHKNVVALAGA